MAKARSRAPACTASLAGPPAIAARSWRLTANSWPCSASQAPHSAAPGPPLLGVVPPAPMRSAAAAAAPSRAAAQSTKAAAALGAPASTRRTSKDSTDVVPSQMGSTCEAANDMHRGRTDASCPCGSRQAARRGAPHPARGSSGWRRSPGCRAAAPAGACPRCSPGRQRTPGLQAGEQQRNHSAVLRQ